MDDERRDDTSADRSEPPPRLGVPWGEAGPHSIDTLHLLLANERRRHLLAHLTDRPEETVRVDELIGVVAERERPKPGPASHRKRVEIDLHHVHLPKLADTDVIEYDPVAGTVRYEGSEALTRLLEATETMDAPDE